MIFLFYFQLNIDDLMKKLNEMEESMVGFCFSTCVLILYSYLMGVDRPHAIEHLVIPSTSGQIVWFIVSTPIK